MLYHLLNIHLHSPIRTLRLFISSTPIDQAFVPMTLKDKKRKSLVRQWVSTSDTRRAIWYSIRLLDAHASAPTTSLVYPFGPTFPSAARAISSIAIPPFAISAAACVLRAYCMLNAAGCAFCAPLYVAGPTTDLSRIDSGDSGGGDECEGHGGGSTNGQALQAWIRDGGVSVVAGLVLCQCNEEQLVKKLGAAGDGSWAGLE